MEKTDYGKILVMYRARHNLSMRELSEKCGVSIQTICNIETGRVEPQRLTKAKIMNLLDEEIV